MSPTGQIVPTTVPDISKASLFELFGSFSVTGSHRSAGCFSEKAKCRRYTSAPPPLSDGQAFARLRLRLTDAGGRVLRGEADRVELLGVDRWIGGTHVTPESDWRWNADSRSVYAVS